MLPHAQRSASLHSWWSDRNKPGATIPLHPLASRLEKRLYHRQVLALIKRYSSHPLSVAQIDSFIPYLGSHRILTSTKVEILNEIHATSHTDLGAEAIVEADLCPILATFLRSSETQVLKLSCSILSNIHPIKTEPLPVPYEALCSSLGTLLSHQNPSVCAAAIRALAKICENNSEAASHAIDAIPQLVRVMHSNKALLDYACTLLDSLSQTWDGRSIWNVMGIYSDLPSTAMSRFATVHRRIVKTLSEFDEQQFDITADADVKRLSTLVQLLKCSDPDVVRGSCQVLNKISVNNDLVINSMVHMHVCSHLLGILKKPDRQKTWFPAVRCLYQISIASSTEGINAIAEAGGLPQLSLLLHSLNNGVLYLACYVVYHIALRQPTRIPDMIGSIAPLGVILSPLNDRRSSVRLASLSAVGQISRSEIGAREIVQHLLPVFLVLVRTSGNRAIIYGVCNILDIIAGYESVYLEVVAIMDSFPFASLLRHPDTAIRRSTISLLRRITRLDSGTRTVIRTAKQGLIDIIKNHGLYEDDTKILLEASTVLGKIVAVESLDGKRLIDASAVLLPLLQHRLSDVQCTAARALLHSCGLIELEKCIIRGHKLLGPLVQLVHASNRGIACHACLSLCSVLRESRNLLVQETLLLLLRQQVTTISPGALHGIFQISCLSKSSAVVIAQNDGLSRLVKMLLSTEFDILCRASRTLGNIARYESLNQQVIDACEGRGCLSLVSLLRYPQIHVVSAAIFALLQISRWSKEGAVALDDANVMPCLVHLLQHRKETSILYQTCCVIGNIASHESLNARVVAHKPCTALVLILRDADLGIIVKSAALDVLCQISRWGEAGAQAVVGANAISALVPLVGSETSSSTLTQSAYSLLHNIAHYKGLVEQVITWDSCWTTLGLFLRYPETTLEAVDTLSQIGVEIFAQFNLLPRLVRLLAHSNTGIFCWILTALGHIMDAEEDYHLDSTPFVALVSLLTHRVPAIQLSAAYAVLKIGRGSDIGAQGVADANALPFLVQLLCPGSRVGSVAWYCELLLAIACDELLERRSVSLIRYDILDLLPVILEQIEHHPNAKTDDIDALPILVELMRSENQHLAQMGCLMLAHASQWHRNIPPTF